MDWETATKIILRVAENVPGGVQGYVKLGHACNNNCRFCTAAWNRQYGDRDTRTVMDEVERIMFEDKVDRMVYSGGEPTVRPDLPEIMSHVKDLGMEHQHIQTNGRRLGDQGYLEQLCHAGLTSCFVSIHGPEPGIHDWLTRSTGAFAQSCAGLGNLERLQVPFSTNTVICKQNYHRLGEIVTLIARKFPSVSKIKLCYPRLQGGAADNLDDIIAPVWEVAPFIRAAIDSGMDMNVNVETEFVPLCLLGMRYDRVDNFYTGRVNLSDLHFADSHYYRPSGGIFYESCEMCDLRQQCRGIDTLHHEAFGEDACFAPVSFSDLGR